MVYFVAKAMETGMLVWVSLNTWEKFANDTQLCIPAENCHKVLVFMEVQQ